MPAKKPSWIELSRGNTTSVTSHRVRALTAEAAVLAFGLILAFPLSDFSYMPFSTRRSYVTTLQREDDCLFLFVSVPPERRERLWLVL